MRRAALIGAAAVVSSGVPAFSADPSFDCTKAESSAEEAICASDDLAALDREVARLYGLAINDPDLGSDAASTLRAYQRGWIKGRDDCWKADDLATCVRDTQAIRIHELRQGYAATRAEDGASTGPFAYACAGLDALVSAVFVQAGSPLVSLLWQDQVPVLPQVEAASGAKYQSGELLFWTKGIDATLDADGASYTCQVVESG